MKTHNSSSQTAVGVLAGLMVLVAGANYLSVWWASYPIAYCAGRWLFHSMGVAVLFQFAIVAMVALTLYGGVRGGLVGMVKPALVMCLLFILPLWGDALFRLGAYCNEDDRWNDVVRGEMLRQRATDNPSQSRTRGLY